MPAKDRYHDTVVRALIKDGWHVVREQLTLIIEGRQVQVDLSVSQGDQAALVPVFVEIKSFIRRSAVEDLALAVGKYSVYRAVLDEAGLETALLYLAVPQTAYDTIFSERLGILMRERLDISLIVIDVEREEITQWIP